MAVKKGQIIEAEITDLAIGGRGLVKIDGLAVFVDGAVPGDRARIRIGRKKRSWAEARVVDLLTPSGERVDPPCPYSGICGGCKWQFLAYDHQLAYKRRHVSEALAHIGGLDADAIPVHPVIASPRTFGYRNKMEFSCTPRRWLLPAELHQKEIVKDFALGLHVPGGFNKILHIDACLLQPDTGNRILNHAQQYMARSVAPAYDLKAHTGFWRFLTIRHSAARDQYLVNIITASENRNEVQPLADQLMAAFPQVAGVVNNVTASKAGVAVGEYELGLAGAAAIRDEIGPFSFEISANSFFQTNTGGARRLYDTVKRYARLSGREKVLDLYCGTGTIALYLAADAAEVTGLEMAESAVADARGNARRHGVENCRFILGDVRDTLAGAVQGNGGDVPDLLIIDPPRAGLHKNVVKQVLALAPPRMVYVSCNPATLARDLGLMREQYRVAEVQPVDMFPHTFHIEAVARLERRD